MKYLITERQYRLLTEEPEEILEIPFKFFNKDWDFLQEYLDRLGNPPYKLIGNLNFVYSKIESLRGLISVGGDLYIQDSKIESLENLQYVGGYLNVVDSNLESLGNLEYVGGVLDLEYSDIETLRNLQYVGDYLNLEYSRIETLGNLQYVGGDLYLRNTPLSRKATEEEIRNEIEVKGIILI